jgi:stress-induced-phosphoprotein 1
LAHNPIPTTPRSSHPSPRSTTHKPTATATSTGQAIKLDPTNASGQLHVFYSNRSAAHLASGNAPAALKDAAQCLRANPAFAKGHSRRGAALFRLGRFQEAAAAYEAGLALEPANAEMRKALAEVQKAAVDNRPLGMNELRPKLNAFLARNALAARLALPRMLLVLATSLYLVPFFSRTFSSHCYRVALAAAFGSHFAAIYSRVGKPQFNLPYLQRGAPPPGL